MNTYTFQVTVMLTAKSEGVDGRDALNRYQDDPRAAWLREALNRGAHVHYSPPIRFEP